jgi:hypothetical protein
MISMKLGFRLLPIAVLALTCSPASSAPKVRIGGVSVNANYMSGPVWYPYYGYGGFYPFPYWGRYYMYDPFWYSPYIHPGLYSGFGYQPNLGEVKLNSSDKEAAVYIDDAYAGPADKLKSIWLEPGAYNLELRGATGEKFGRRIYVLTGKTLQIRAKLEPVK